MTTCIKQLTISFTESVVGVVSLSAVAEVQIEFPSRQSDRVSTAVVMSIVSLSDDP